MPAQKRPAGVSLFLHSTLTFATAFLITVVIHEFAHGLMAVALGLQPVVHGTFESDIAGTPLKRALIALAGPIVSLAVGLIIYAVPCRGHGPMRLFWTWMGLLGIETFFGYLLTAPFLPSGDIGLDLQLAGAPFAARVLVALIGGAGIVGLGWAAARQFLPLTPSGAPDRMSQLRSLGLFGWLGGVVLVLAATFPPSYGSIVVAVIASGIFTLLIRQFLPAVPDRPAAGLTLGSPLPIIIIFVAVAVVIRVVIDPGIVL